MATHASAEKRNRQNVKRRMRNRSARSEIRTTIKSALQAAEKGEKDVANEKVKKASSLLSRAAISGLHHKNNVARRVSRLNKAVNKLLVESSASEGN